MTSSLLTFSGGCHCGALGVTFRTALSTPQWKIRACQCRFCRSHGALTTTDPAGRLAFHANDAGLLQRYRFGTRSADFLICRRCGVYIGAQIETSRGAFGTLNTRVLERAAESLPGALPADYEAESPSERIARREQRWTPLDGAL
ncbi:MAG TPA: hypothetical protein VKQ31_06750 [Steroidobacteraceae bacterium]|nr:hypothetical protein [Steroidobacteraceae bacterium]